MAMLGVFILLLPRVFPGRLIGLAWIAPLLLVKPIQAPDGEAWVTVLDVGQGLASVVQTQNHTLVYDVGPAFSSGYDAGEDMVLPFLQHQGRKRIDAVVISHANADHDGGLESVLAGLPVDVLWTGEVDLREVENVTQQTCLAGIEWQWDGVRFSFLHPQENTKFSDNNASCVLRIEAGGQVILMTGDIEKAAEVRLLNRYDKVDSLGQRQSLEANILVAPHHGSKTSSTQSFLDQVDPDMVIISAGYWNRFKHPHPSVSERYRELGAKIVSTAESGAITVKLGAHARGSDPDSNGGLNYGLGRYRIALNRYWIEAH